jgi:beta-lactamase superfamily II metal-dependent hydrolase
MTRHNREGKPGYYLTLIRLRLYATLIAPAPAHNTLAEQSIMNIHFHATGKKFWPEYPEFAYAKIDSIEQILSSETGDIEQVSISFDAIERISADSLIESCPLPEWPGFWEAFFKNQGNNFFSDLFENIKLYQIELISTWKEISEFLDLDEFKKESDVWFTLKLNSTSNTGLPVFVYGGLFAEGLKATLINCSALSLTSQTTAQLNAAFSMQYWPKTSVLSLNHLLSQSEAEMLAVYDVGQGSASALANSDGYPTLFYDIGCGVYRNAKTAPSNQILCPHISSTIILSHWDTDHWAGANRFVDPQNASSFLSKKWIAPCDLTVGPRHIVFAYSIISSGGQLNIVTGGWRQHGPIRMQNNSELMLLEGSGTSRNDSGIALKVTENSSSDRHWLLTGDVQYNYLPLSSCSRFVAIIVPHHGAKMKNQFSIPSPYNQNYNRLIYSFGSGNCFNHPTSDCVNDHQSVGWQHGRWIQNNPGDIIAGGNVLATACHLNTPPNSNHLGGIAVGWRGAPQISCEPCIPIQQS